MSETSTLLNVAEPLTADDVAALRMAESYSFHTHSAYNGSILRLYTNAPGAVDDAVVFSKRQQVLFPEIHNKDTRARTLTIDGAASGYGENLGHGGWQWPSWTGSQVQEPTPECFFSGYLKDQWRTIVRSLRVGTVLKIEWTADNNTEIARDAGLHLDEVRLIATTVTRTGSRRDVFNVGWATCRDNSARMIRRKPAF